MRVVLLQRHQAGGAQRHATINHQQQGALRMMSKQTNNVALAYDGTLEGLMTAVFWAYANHCNPEDIRPAEHVQTRLDQEVIDIDTDMDLALRVRKGICRQLGPGVWRAITQAAASDNPNTGTAVYRFIRFALASRYACPCGDCPRKGSCTTPCSLHRGSVLDEWSNPDVGPMLELRRRVLNECEKMRQFIRFEHTAGDYWFARCNPNASVVPLVMDHFAARFNTQRFVIFDEVHHLAGVSQAGSWQLVFTDDVAPPPPSSEEARMQDAWRRFYDALSVECRYNPELRRHFMPKRLWANITEMAG